MLAAHHEAHQAMLHELHGLNRQRIKAQGGRGGEEFSIGDVVLFLPPKMGKQGSNLDGNRLTCRVVGVSEKSGGYKLRCNTGVITGFHGGGEVLRRAPAASADRLTFGPDADPADAPKVSVTQAVKAELSTVRFRAPAGAPAAPRRRR